MGGALRSVERLSRAVWPDVCVLSRSTLIQVCIVAGMWGPVEPCAYVFLPCWGALGTAAHFTRQAPTAQPPALPHPSHATTGTQAYVRKLEARLLSVRGAVELQQHCRDLKGQLDSQVGRAEGGQ